MGDRVGVELLYNWVELGAKVVASRIPDRYRPDVVGKATPDRGGPRKTPDGVDPNIRRTRKTQRDDHNRGVKIWSLCSVSSTLSHANLEQPFRTLAIKWEVTIIVKKSSCVFLPASLSCVIYSCVCLWYCVVVMLNDDVDDYITLSDAWFFYA